MFMFLGGRQTSWHCGTVLLLLHLHVVFGTGTHVDLAQKGMLARRLLATAGAPQPGTASPPALAPAAGPSDNGTQALLARRVPFPFCYLSETDGYFRAQRQCSYPAIQPLGVPADAQYARACCTADPRSGNTNTCFYWDINTRGANCSLGGSQLFASCCVYPPPAIAPPPPPIVAAQSGGGTSTGAIVGGAVGGVAAALLAAVALLFWIRHRRSAAVANVLGLDTVHSDDEALKEPPDGDKEWGGKGDDDDLTSIQTDSANTQKGGSLVAISPDATPLERNRNLLSGAALRPEEIKLEVKRSGKLKLLGRGAYGEVYMARWRHTRVAVKVLLENEAEQQRQFCEEASLLRSLRHPNIVLFLGACLQPGKKMMVVTELCEGGDLASALAHDVTPPRRLSWYLRGHAILLNVACGMAYLHSQSICHYDIKPGNVLLDKARLTAKISDVGLSKIMVHSQASQATLRGTFQYMAPEMMTYEHGITLAVDVYSFGIMMQEVITGESPDKRRGPLTEPRVPEDCPQVAVDLYMRCMDRDPAKRPTSAELVEALEDMAPLPSDGPRRVRTAPGAVPAGDAAPAAAALRAGRQKGDFQGMPPRAPDAPSRSTTPNRASPGPIVARGDSAEDTPRAGAALVASPFQAAGGRLGTDGQTDAESDEAGAGPRGTVPPSLFSAETASTVPYPPSPYESNRSAMRSSFDTLTTCSMNTNVILPPSPFAASSASASGVPPPSPFETQLPSIPSASAPASFAGPSQGLPTRRPAAPVPLRSPFDTEPDEVPPGDAPFATSGRTGGGRSRGVWGRSTGAAPPSGSGRPVLGVGALKSFLSGKSTAGTRQQDSSVCKSLKDAPAEGQLEATGSQQKFSPLMSPYAAAADQGWDSDKST